MTNRIVKIVFLLLGAGISFVAYQGVSWIHAGGPLMVIIIFSSYIGVALIAAKIKQFLGLNFETDIFLKTIFEQLERQRIKEALDYCDKMDHPLSRIIKSGIMKYDRPRDEIKEAMEDSFLFELPLLEDKLDAFSALIQTVPLVGLLGTFLGFINIFGVIHAKKIAEQTVALLDFSAGLWQALICPAAGFLVVIPLLLAHHYLTSRVKMFIEETQKATTELLSFLMERRVSS